MRRAAGSRAGLAARRRLGPPLRALVAAGVLACSAAACTTTGQPTAATATPRGPTVAFESIDGPPENIFHRMVQTLSEEADARQLAVVTRTGPAQYRVRGYLSAQTEGRRSVVAWVWDVYDADQRRATRIVGEEAAGPAGHGTWAIADDQVLRRIARSGMDRLAAFLASPAASPGPSPPPAREPALTVAAAGDRAATPAGAALAAADAAPLPPRRPAGTAFAPASLAWLGPDR